MARLQVHTTGGESYTFYTPSKGEGLAEMKWTDTQKLMKANVNAHTLDEWAVAGEAEYRRDYQGMGAEFWRDNFVFHFEAPSDACRDETIAWVDSLRPNYAHQLRCNFWVKSAASFYTQYGGVIAEGAGDEPTANKLMLPIDGGVAMEKEAVATGAN